MCNSEFFAHERERLLDKVTDHLVAALSGDHTATALAAEVIIELEAIIREGEKE